MLAPYSFHRPIRCPARRESVALVRPAQPVLGGLQLGEWANCQRQAKTDQLSAAHRSVFTCRRHTVGVPLKRRADMLKSLLQRWRERRRQRRIDSRERKLIAQETLRNFKQWTGDEGGPPMGPPGF